MPYHDGTGPYGNGSPGRGQGPCGNTGTNRYNNKTPGDSIVYIILETLKSLLSKKTNTKRS